MLCQNICFVQAVAIMQSQVQILVLWLGFQLHWSPHWRITLKASTDVVILLIILYAMSRSHGDLPFHGIRPAVQVYS